MGLVDYGGQRDIWVKLMEWPSIRIGLVSHEEQGLPQVIAFRSYFGMILDMVAVL